MLFNVLEWFVLGFTVLEWFAHEPLKFDLFLDTKTLIAAVNLKSAGSTL